MPHFPVSCQYLINLDSWAIANMVMPPLFQDPHSWISAARTRNEVSPDILGTLSPSHFQYNLKFNEFLRSAHFTTIQSFQTMLCRAVDCDDGTEFSLRGLCNRFRVPIYFICPPDASPELFLNRVYVWVSFLRQDDVRPYWCEVERVGLMSRTEIDAAEPFKSITGFMKSLPKALQEELAPIPGRRMSRTTDKYVGGPLSLVNHACKHHANCHLNHHTCALEAEEHIGPGQKLRYVYNSSEEELHLTSGFKCYVCVT